MHPRKNSFGNDDNDSVSGSADITNKVDVVMTYKRDKDLLDDERLLTVSKNRLTGKLAVGGKAIHLYFDEASKRIGDDTPGFYSPLWMGRRCRGIHQYRAVRADGNSILNRFTIWQTNREGV
ncbi:MAG: hypothetical protein ACLU6Y_18320 [Ruminococcus sp.]